MNPPGVARTPRLPLFAFAFRFGVVIAIAATSGGFLSAAAIDSANKGRPGDQLLEQYFARQTEQLSSRCLTDVRTLDDWNARKGEMRRQLAEMLGLWPMPERTDLHPVVTKRTTHDGFVVDNVQFQSRPGFYVTANLYLSTVASNAPLPTILYLSGHGPVISNNVSYGNKVAYQHHGAWFARHGYACLIVDSVQLGEILGLHHGTYRENLWWWNARGYTPAGAEAWNGLRALDYLSSRPEIDTNRFGVTGRSGGGAYSWWIAALDDRIKAAAPVAGITDLHNHVIDGTVEGHCDCMFTVNTYRWDYPQVAALVAPRPLLIVNTDADSIFPLDGVGRLHASVRNIYRLHGAADKLGLVIGPGPHKDTQDLQVPVLRWFNRHLRNIDPVIEVPAVPLCTPEDLRVLQSVPSNAINTNIHDTFVPAAPPASVPSSRAVWEPQRDHWLSGLAEKSFAGWPRGAPPCTLRLLWSAKQDRIRLEAFEFLTEDGWPLRLYVAQSATRRRPEALTVTVLGESDATGVDAHGALAAASDETFERWLGTMAVGFGDPLKPELAALNGTLEPNPAQFAGLRNDLAADGVARAWLTPRGIGLTTWTTTPKQQIHIRRRFMLLGQTLDAMRVWDIRRAVQAVRAKEEWRTTPLTLRASGPMACNALYAALFERGVQQLDLHRLPASHRNGPDYLNVLKTVDIPQTLALIVERMPVTLRETDITLANFARETIRNLGWSRERLKVVSRTEQP